MTQHLWEVDHPYYCSESNFYSNDCHTDFDSWSDFFDDMGSSDFDMNLLFRWDWNIKNSDDEDAPDYYGRQSEYHPTINDNDLGYTLCLFFMQQRKGKFVAFEVTVCRDDEVAVKEFLLPRLAHLKLMWEPLS